jgi:hypothetical protein
VLLDQVDHGVGGVAGHHGGVARNPGLPQQRQRRLQRILAGGPAAFGPHLGVGPGDEFIQAGRLLHVDQQEAGRKALAHQAQRETHLVQGKFGTVDWQQDFHGGPR